MSSRRSWRDWMRASAPSRPRPAARPSQLRAALPRGTALVDLLVYTAFQPPAQGKGGFQTERRLVAFVVRPDRPIARVDLGPIGADRKAIDDWRPVLAGPEDRDRGRRSGA